MTGLNQLLGVIVLIGLGRLFAAIDAAISYCVADPGAGASSRRAA